MTRNAVRTLAIFALLLPLATAYADRPEKRDAGVRWFTDLDAAIQEGIDRNIPLYVALHKDH